MKRKILFIFIFVVTFGYSHAQYFDGIGGSLGVRASEFSIVNKQGVTNNTSGYSSLYCLDLNLNKRIFNKKFYLISGINFSREQIDFNPLIRINEIEQFSSMFNDTYSVYEFRMWNYQIGIPLKIGFNLYKGWRRYAPFFVIPGVNINAGFVNNIVLNKTYNDVVLLQNYGKPNEIEYYNESINKQVSAYYLKTIANYCLVGQIGVDLFDKGRNFDYGISLSYNHYLTSPFSNLDISTKYSIDIKIFVIFKLIND